MDKLVAWLQQPTSVAGLAGAAGALAGAISHEITWQQAIPVLVSALIAILLPDNTGGKAAA